MAFLKRHAMFALLLVGIAAFFFFADALLQKTGDAVKRSEERAMLQGMANYCGRTGGSWIERRETEWVCFTRPGGEVVWRAGR